MKHHPRSSALAHARELHQRIITFDSHIDVLPDLGSPRRPAHMDGPGCFDLAKARRGMLSGAALVVHATALRPGPTSAAAGRREQDERYRIITRIAEDHPDRAGIARTPRQFRRLVEEDRFAIVLSLQNTAPLHSLDDLDAWARRGIAQLAFTFIGTNQWAGSARPYPFIGPGPQPQGLSELGRAAIPRLNDLGVLVDVSQLSSPAFAEVLELTRTPVVASHSAVRALVDIDRNLTDGELRAMRDNGGVAQIVGFGPYLRPLSDPMRRRLRAHWVAYGLASPNSLADLLSVNDPTTADWGQDTFDTFLHEFHEILELDRPEADIADLVDAIDHAVTHAGIDHVGIGSDFNHSSGVIGWMTVADNLNVTAELVRRGYTDQEIAQLWGENFLRVWQQALDAADPARSPADGNGDDCGATGTTSA
ncbi:dipeptidase [Streptomyces galilaeus]|uniref:dipeptidase n=1 Tax=Streptomyces galilaeus TaxID=33899 RepID=UPI0038F81AF2